MIYVDIYGLYNVKICIEGKPSGNDGPIITSYAEKLGLPIDKPRLFAYYRELGYRHENYIPSERLPGKKEPPPSRDTILGWFNLNLLSIDKLIANDWNFSPYPVPPFNPFKTIAAAWRLKNAHRNALWENGGEPHMFRFAFSVPIQDRAWMLRKAGRPVPLLYSIWEWVSKKLSSDSASSKLIDWLKYGKEPDLAVFEEYFGKDHPFCQKIRGEI